MMATLRCDHPDIEEFVQVKRDSTRLRHFNLSVLVTDKFMEAVRNGDEWELKFNGEVYKSVRADLLWNDIMQATYDVAEPGVLFIDEINEMNPLKDIETIYATNPCGEQPLPPYGACLLGSMNLTKYVRLFSGTTPIFDWDQFKSDIHLAIRMLDNVIDISKFPLEAQEKEAKEKRRIGLGITGLGSTLAMLGYKYGGKESVEFSRDIGKSLQECSIRASENLGSEKGTFPAYSKIPSGSFKPRRNSHVTSIAPTGTISLFMDNVSSGIEPIFDLAYTRTYLDAEGVGQKQIVEDYARAWDRLTYGVRDLPEHFVTVKDLTWQDHLNIQEAFVPYIDSSISKTINLPEDISFEDFKEVYMEAYKRGFKGCTTYRPNEVTGSILSSVEEEEESVVISSEFYEERDDVLEGS